MQYPVLLFLSPTPVSKHWPLLLEQISCSLMVFSYAFGEWSVLSGVSFVELWITSDLYPRSPPHTHTHTHSPCNKPGHRHSLWYLQRVDGRWWCASQGPGPPQTRSPLLSGLRWDSSVWTGGEGLGMNKHHYLGICETSWGNIACAFVIIGESNLASSSLTAVIPYEIIIQPSSFL